MLSSRILMENTGMANSTPTSSSSAEWDHSTSANFLEYYARQSLSPQTLERFSRVRDKALALLAEANGHTQTLEVVDIGCGAGTQCRLWAQSGHRVHGIDVNQALIEVARQRAQEEQLAITFDVGSATELPYDDGSMDVCLLPELLEHVADWQSCLNEAVRVLKPGGLLYLSTTNWLCPIQEEFSLPLYSWYPGFLKRHYERLAVSTRPEIANHATYPAVNWFSFYSLAAYLEKRGLRSLDRFDMIDREDLGGLKKVVIGLARTIPPLRFAGHVLTPSTVIFALKQG